MRYDKLFLAAERSAFILIYFDDISDRQVSMHSIDYNEWGEK